MYHVPCIEYPPIEAWKLTSLSPNSRELSIQPLKSYTAQSTRDISQIQYETSHAVKSKIYQNNHILFQQIFSIYNTDQIPFKKFTDRWAITQFQHAVKKRPKLSTKRMFPRACLRNKIKILTVATRLVNTVIRLRGSRQHRARRTVLSLATASTILRSGLSRWGC